MLVLISVYANEKITFVWICHDICIVTRKKKDILTDCKHLSRWFFNSLLFEYFFSHLLHIYFLSVWSKWSCSLKSRWCSKLLSQYLQIMVHFLLCSRNLSFLVNFFSHLSHENEWVPCTEFWCLFRSDGLKNVLEHTSHFKSIVKMKLIFTYCSYIPPDVTLKLVEIV